MTYRIGYGFQPYTGFDNHPPPYFPSWAKVALKAARTVDSHAYKFRQFEEQGVYNWK